LLFTSHQIIFLQVNIPQHHFEIQYFRMRIVQIYLFHIELESTNQPKINKSTFIQRIINIATMLIHFIPLKQDWREGGGG